MWARANNIQLQDRETEYWNWCGQFLTLTTLITHHNSCASTSPTEKKTTLPLFALLLLGAMAPHEMINRLHPTAPSICIVTFVGLRIAVFHTQAAQLARLPMGHTDLIESLKT